MSEEVPNMSVEKGQEEEVAAKYLTALVEEERTKQKAEEEAKNPVKPSITGLENFVTKQDLAAFAAELKKENEGLKSLFLKAKAQGKATIKQQNESKTDEIKRIFGDTLPRSLKL